MHPLVLLYLYMAYFCIILQKITTNLLYPGNVSLLVYLCFKILLLSY